VAAILVLIVAVIGLVVVNVPGPGGAAATPTPAAGAAAPSPTATPSPSPTPTATPTPSPSPTPSPTPDATTVDPATFPPSPSPTPSGGVGGIVATPPPSPTPTPVPTLAPWADRARPVIAAGGRVVAERDQLDTLLAAPAVTADDIAKALREVNTSIGASLVALRNLERAGAPAAQTAPLRTVLEDALAISIETLGTSVTDLASYRAGATSVVETLVPLETLLRRLAAEAGLPDPYPTGTPAGP
jgi:hypothetical protein